MKINPALRHPIVLLTIGAILISFSMASATLSTGWVNAMRKYPSPYFPYIEPGIIHTAISSRTWEKINQRLLKCAHQDKVENGRMLRIDSTVTETDIHAPTDSDLLWDSVRSLVW